MNRLESFSDGYSLPFLQRKNSKIIFHIIIAFESSPYCSWHHVSLYLASMIAKNALCIRLKIIL